LAWKAGPVVTKMLDDRAAKIKADLDEAARLRDEARRTLIDFQQKQRDAMKEADGIVAQARLEAERVAQQAERNQAVDVAIAAVRRILADDLGAARKSALIDAAIDDLSKRLN